MDMIKLLGPGAVLGGVAAAMLCGAGAAGADTGAEPRNADRSVQAGAPASAAKPARTARASAAARPAAAEARGSQAQPTLASPAEL